MFSRQSDRLYAVKREAFHLENVYGKARPDSCRTGFSVHIRGVRPTALYFAPYFLSNLTASA